MSPLRVFDTKNEAVRRVLADAPTIGESLCASCREHFAAGARGPRRLRRRVRARADARAGLDYYTRTVFEFVNEGLDAAQATHLRGRAATTT